MATDPLTGPGQIQTPDALRPKTQQGDGAGRSQATGSEGSAQAPAKLPAQPAGQGEKVQISRQARELLAQSELMRQARNSLDQSPEVRDERVREVKRRLESGVYETKGVRDELAHRLSGILSELPLDEPD